MFPLFFGSDKDYKTPGDKSIGEVSFTVYSKEKVNTLCLTKIICVCMVTGWSNVFFIGCIYSVYKHIFLKYLYILFIYY